MKKFLFFLLFISFHKTNFAQEKHRRDGYFETFVEVKDSIDSIVVFKSTREMITYHEGKKVKKYIISLGMEPVGKKEFEGDLKTPEGHYIIDKRSRQSVYHANLNISYPSEQDSIYAAKFNKSAGGDIKIHGFPNSHRKDQERTFLNTDWTVGCIAVSNYEVDELYSWVIENCPIVIFP